MEGICSGKLQGPGGLGLITRHTYTRDKRTGGGVGGQQYHWDHVMPHKAPGSKHELWDLMFALQDCVSVEQPEFLLRSP